MPAATAPDSSPVQYFLQSSVILLIFITLTKPKACILAPVPFDYAVGIYQVFKHDVFIHFSYLFLKKNYINRAQEKLVDVFQERFLCSH